MSILPHRLDMDRDAVQFIRLEPGDFLEAAFLDERIETAASSGAWLGWDVVAERMRDRPAGAFPHYLLHPGHCGSTLVSRLLAEIGVMPLREPNILRDFARIDARIGSAYGAARQHLASRLELTLRLFARGAPPKALKASSFCNDLAPAFMAPDPSIRATVVFARPRAFIANLLAGPTSRQDVASLASMRIDRLARRLGPGSVSTARLTAGMLMALAWAAEMTALAELADRLGTERVLLLDFDSLLEDLPAGLRRVAAHVAPDCPVEQVEALAGSPTLMRYSKVPQEFYDRQLRRQVIAAAEHEWSADVRDGLEWLEQMASRHPAVARAVRVFGDA